MQPEPGGPEGGPVSQHVALLYVSDEDYLDALVPFVAEGLESGEKVLVAVPTDRAALLQNALSEEAPSEEAPWEGSRSEYPDGGAGVLFLDSPMARPGGRPASPAAAIAAYRKLFDAHLGDGVSRLRLVAEVPPALSPADHLAWAQYEAAIGAAFGGTAVTIVCPYDLRSSPPAVLVRVEHTHPDLWRDGRRRPSPGYTDPASALRAMPSEAMAVEDFPPALVLRLGPEVSIPRDALRVVAVRAGLGPDRLDDLLLAFTEVATNALIHGSSVARAKVWASNGTVVCTVTDSGPGVDDPLVGLVPPSHGAEPDPGGLGLWVARQLCDTLDLVRGPQGTTVRFVVRR